MGVRTEPELFIIESLGLDDEDSKSQEGEILSQMLKLSGKEKTKYFYIRTERELDEIVDLFDESNYRYLHISCHANGKEMATTFDPVSYAKLGQMLAPCVKGRRVFVSACEMANDTLAGALLKNTGCYSLIGPAEAIRFGDAAAFWTTFYHLMFKLNHGAMKHRNLEFYVDELSDLFGEPINYFRADTNITRGYSRVRKRGKLYGGDNA